MKYKGIELKKFSSDEQVAFNPPKKMLVWDDNIEVREDLVYAYIPQRVIYKVIGHSCAWAHCAEIPERKFRRATNRELAKWLAQGNGIYRLDCLPDHWGSDITLKRDTCECPVNENVQIRKWDDTDWHDPTVDYMGIENDKENQ